MKTTSMDLTLADDPQELGNRGGSRGLTYPTAERLRTREKGDHGVPAERLIRSYVIEPSGCWRWIRARTTSGYGHFSIHHVYYQAHVLVYILHRGTPPVDLEPDHLCRNRWCVNPDCLEWVTHAVNVQRRGRAPLSPEQVATIRERGKAAGVRVMAREYGVNHATISRILAGLTWPEPAHSVSVAA